MRSGDIPWATPADLSDDPRHKLQTTARTITSAGLNSCSAQLVPPRVVILSSRAPIGSLGITQAPTATNQGCRALIQMPGMNPQFLAYALSSARADLNAHGSGSTFLEISGTALGCFRIAVPPSDEQNRIVAYLNANAESIDELIQRQHQHLALLREKRQALVSHAVTQGLNPDAPTKPSGIKWLGDIPAHWNMARLATLFHQVDERGDEALPVLSVSIHTGVSDSELDESELDRKVTRSEDRTKYKQVLPDDLVYNMMRAWQGGLGTVAIHGMVSPAYVVARPTSNNLTRFIEALLRTPNAVEEIRRRSRGVTDFRLRLYWEEFKNLRIPLPPLEEQQQILERIAEFDDQASAIASECERSIRLLSERRSALISAAVTGKIDVRNAPLGMAGHASPALT